MSLPDVKFILRKHGIRPDDEKGQNFLVNDDMLEAIAIAATYLAPRSVLEIGSGIGNLTVKLAERYEKVVTVEIDARFKKNLDAVSGVHKNITVLYGDILKLRFEVLQQALGVSRDGEYVVISNIPYYLTARLIKHIVQAPLQPSAIFFLVQREVAARVCEKEGNHSKLSLSVQLYGTPSIQMVVPKENFYPIPQVDSALLRITALHRWNFKEPEALVWRLITIGFSSKRKKLLNNLAAGLHQPRGVVERYVTEARIPLTARAQELSIDQWRTLARSVPNT